MFESAIAAVRAGADAAVPAVPVTDTLREIDGTVVDRARLVAVQTPQAFRADALRRAHAGRPEATDDAAVVEAAGGKVVLVAGDRWNLKITEPSDLVVVEALLAARS
jgi:2-C-methyl-D-erythritol 4-phosphate cytidylyltransferase